MTPEGITKDWVLARCEVEGDCWLWQLATNKAGNPKYPMHVDGRMTSRNIRPLMWTVVAGRRKTANQRITMKCNEPGCLNPDHMRTTTMAEVMIRTAKSEAVRKKKSILLRSIVMPHAKLDMDKARYIRASDKSLHTLARELGVSHNAVSRVRRNEAWRDNANPFLGLM